MLTLSRSFDYQPLWRKSLIVVAGPVANFLLAIFIYTCLFLAHEEVRIAPVVGSVVAGSSAESSGFLPNDRILTVNGNTISTFNEIREYTVLSADEELEFVVLRGGSEYSLFVKPILVDRVDNFGNSYRVSQIGISADTSASNIERVKLGFLDALGKGINQTWFLVKVTLNFLSELFLGKQDAKELRGPVGIGQITGQFATLGFSQLISLAAVLSVSIGLLNLFPIPLLDGGHLLFYGISAIIGRPVPDKVLDFAYKLGFFVLLGFMLYVTSNDILRLLPL